MVQLLDDIFNLAQYKTEVDRTQARMVYGISLVMIVLFIPYILFVPMAVGERLTYLERVPDEPALVFYTLAFFGIGILTLWGVSAGRLALSSWGPSWMWILGLYVDSIQTGIVNASNGVILLALILLAGLLKGGRGLLFGSVMALGALALGLAIRSELTLDMLPQYITNLDELKATGPAEFVGIGMQYIGASILIYLFLLHSRVRRKEGVSMAIQDRLLTADIITQIAQQVSQRSSLDELLSKIVGQINDRFDFIYHSQVFLIDDVGVTARLVASTGEVGEMLLAREHGLEVGSQSVIGRVTMLGVVTVAHSGGQDSVHRKNELLPETAVEAAFPLRVGDTIIGALDVQSKQLDALDDENLQATLQALADSITLAIDNVSQFERAEERLRENERLIEESRSGLREVERLNERLTGRVWSEYLHGAPNEYSLAMDMDAQTVESDAQWTPALSEAMQENHLVQNQAEDKQFVAVPLKVRGYVVGAIEFELEAEQSFSSEDLDLIQEVSERFGLAVESARLMDESRRVAQREALVNQISSRLQANNSVNSMLVEAANGLQDALKASKVAIRLGAPPKRAGARKGGGSR